MSVSHCLVEQAELHRMSRLFRNSILNQSVYRVDNNFNLQPQLFFQISVSCDVPTLGKLQPQLRNRKQVLSDLARSL